MFKRILLMILSLVLTMSLCACGLNQLFPGSHPSTGTDELIGDATSYRDFIAVMKEIKERGDKTAQLGLPVNSEYYYSFAGASVSALRYAVEYILWLKGEGDTRASFMADSRYTGWETIAEINYASPYPSYFEGLLLEVQGKYEECLEPYAWASVMPMFPEEGIDFYYLKKMDVASLYELRDELRDLEDTIYGAYTPVLTGAEWDRGLFDAEFLVARSYDCVQSGDYSAALRYAKNALKADPFNVTVWHSAAMCAMYALDLELMGEYVDEGLAIFPQDETLRMIRQSMIDAVSEMEAGQ